MNPSLPFEPDQGFDSLLGLVITSADPEAGEVVGEVEIGPQHLQPAGLVHGGVIASIAETLASIGTWLAVSEQGSSAQGLSNQTSFLRPLLEGKIHAKAEARHRGRTTWVWEVEVTDDDTRLCALVRMTIAVRPLPEQA